jgi:hypothetical protein
MPNLAARLLDIQAAAAYLGGISPWTVRDFIASGEIPSVRLPRPRAGDGRAMRRVLLDRADLDLFVEKWKQLDRAEPSPIPVVRRRGRPRGSKTKPAARR